MLFPAVDHNQIGANMRIGNPLNPIRKISGDEFRFGTKIVELLVHLDQLQRSLVFVPTLEPIQARVSDFAAVGELLSHPHHPLAANAITQANLNQRAGFGLFDGFVNDPVIGRLGPTAPDKVAPGGNWGHGYFS